MGARIHRLRAALALKEELTRVVAVGALLLAGCGQPEPPLSESEPPQRIILIVIDMLRRDHVGVHGASIPTPHIDALAARGQALDRAASAFGSTTMSMAALFTGRTPSLETGDRSSSLNWHSRNWCGLARFAETRREPCIPTSVDTLAERLRAAGYETLGVASNLLLYAPSGFERGFDVWEEPGVRTTEAIQAYRKAPRPTRGAYGGTLAASVNRATRHVLAQRKSDRFFLYAHFMDAHEFERLGISYEEGVALADAGVGEFLNGLDADGLLDDALVVLTSDHGERRGETHPVPGRGQHFGNPPFDYLLKVPLIVAPRLLDDSRSLVRGQDLMSLILERAGAPPPAAPELAEDELFLSEWQWQTLRLPRWKAMFHRTKGKSLLFDLAEDPAEQRNVAPLHPARVAAMRDRVTELTASLAKRSDDEHDLSDEDREKLRAIGYIEAIEEADSRSPGHERKSQQAK